MDEQGSVDRTEATSSDGEVRAVDPMLPHTPPFGIKAVHPGDEPPVRPPDLGPIAQHRDRPAGNGLAAMASTGGVVLAIIGTFLPWIVADRPDGAVDHLIGWDFAGDAMLVLVTGLIAAGVTTAFWVGQRGLVHKLLLLVTGGLLLAVAGVEIADIRAVDAASPLERSVGSGLPVIALGGVLLVGGALLDRGPWSFGSR
jgi:hypothetical protein